MNIEVVAGHDSKDEAQSFAGEYKQTQSLVRKMAGKFGVSSYRSPVSFVIPPVPSKGDTATVNVYIHFDQDIETSIVYNDGGKEVAAKLYDFLSHSLPLQDIVSTTQVAGLNGDKAAVALVIGKTYLHQTDLVENTLIEALLSLTNYTVAASVAAVDWNVQARSAVTELINAGVMTEAPTDLNQPMAAGQLLTLLSRMLPTKGEIAQ